MKRAGVCGSSAKSTCLAGKGPEFKPQYWKKQNKTKQKTPAQITW
jgi:hypothetical protein